VAQTATDLNGHPVTYPSPLHDPEARGFASDNYAGIHPEILEAIGRANGGHQVAYGADVYTRHLQEVFQHHFGAEATAYPVFNGTGANVVSLQAMTERWDAVICAESAHINVDECGAPERVGGLKLLAVPTAQGKLTPELVERAAGGRGDEHRAQPKVVSITQSTELGTCYSAGEIAAIADVAHARGLAVHLDGTRLFNAAVASGVPARSCSNECVPPAARPTAIRGMPAQAGASLTASVRSSPSARLCRIFASPCKAAARGYEVSPACPAEARLPKLSPA